MAVSFSIRAICTEAIISDPAKDELKCFNCLSYFCSCIGLLPLAVIHKDISTYLIKIDKPYFKDFSETKVYDYNTIIVSFNLDSYTLDIENMECNCNL